MYNYTCFKIKFKIRGDPIPTEIFSMWLLQVKSSCHKWKVQNIHQTLPLACNIDLGLDYTKLWYADDQVAEPVDLPYYPSVEQIFGEDMNILLKGLKELDFYHPRIQKKVLQ